MIIVNSTIQISLFIPELDVNWMLVAKNKKCHGRQINMGFTHTTTSCAEACYNCTECEEITMFALNCYGSECACNCQFESDKDGCKRNKQESSNDKLFKYLSKGIKSFSFQSANPSN